MTEAGWQSLRPSLRNKIASHVHRISSLDVAAKDYRAQKAQLDQDLSRYRILFDTMQADERTRQHQEDLKILDDDEYGSFPTSVATSPTSPSQQNRVVYSSPTHPTDFTPSTDHVLNDPPNVLAPGRCDIARAGSGPSGPSQILNTSAMEANSSWLSAAEAEPSSASTSASSSGQASSARSPPSQSLANGSRKRPRESLQLSSPSVGHVSKVMRTTPSPPISGPTTPSSLESFEFPEDSDLFRLMGGNPKDHMRDLRRDQKEQERIIQERKDQEERDAEFARHLFAQDETELVSGESSGNWSQPSFAPRSTVQTVLDSSGGYLVPNPTSSQGSHDVQAVSSGLPSSRETPRYDAERMLDLDAPQHSFNQDLNAPQYSFNKSRVDTTDFIDIASDDDEIPEDLSSDLVELEPAEWHSGSMDTKPPRILPWMTQNSISNNAVNVQGRKQGGYEQTTSSYSQTGISPTFPYANMYRRTTGYAGTNSYNDVPVIDATGSSSWSATAARLGQTLATAAGDAFDVANPFRGNQTGAILGLPSNHGGSMYGYGSPGSYSNPYLVSGFDHDFSRSASQVRVLDMLSGHSINGKDPKNRELVDRYTDRINYLTNDPTRTSAEIKELLENIRPDEDLPGENREGTPEAMTYPLLEHQKLGLAWMKNMETGSNKGGILADDMGLGKTIQALALMVSRRSSDSNRKTNLVVAPVALMKQWEREIMKKLKPGREHRLSCYILHGSNRQTTWDELKKYDVVLTTFGTLANEVKRKEGIDMAKRINPNWRPMTKADHLPLLGAECKWYRVIIDEAQCIKNKSTKAAIGAAQLQSLTRFCMTGTPMMNNVTELYSLIHFLRIKPYNVTENFTRDFTKPLKSPSARAKDQAMQKFQALLKAILLRRTKKSKIDGKPILTLPERTTESQHAVFSEDEEAFYRALENQTQLQFNRYLKAGTVGRNYSNVLVLLLRLRQACCHPHLIKDHCMSSGITEVSTVDMQKLATELAPDVVARIKSQGETNEHSALECPVCMDMAENATIFIPCGHNACSECFARITDPSQAIANGDAGEGHADIKCPNCRGKIIPAKVIDHATFKKVHVLEEATSDTLEPQHDDVSASPNDASVDSDDSDDSDVEDDTTKCKAKAARPPTKTLAQLKKESSSNAKSRRQYLKRLAKEWETSGKIEKTLEILRATLARQDGAKTIIFSQFTSLLDLLEVPIYREGWNYKRYDGSMSSNTRNEAVLQFSDDPACTIMLVSLKAGNSGLNLVAASQVIIFDPFWNPYVEEQAIDRAHRIGQMRPVQVHRILIPNTVEDRILALQEKKRTLIEGALDEKASRNIGRLGERELAFLFVSLSRRDSGLLSRDEHTDQSASFYRACRVLETRFVWKRISFFFFADPAKSPRG